MKNNTDIIPNYFNVVFDADKRSINYDIAISTKLEGKLKAYATVYAFGFGIIHETIDLCDLNLKQFCPITPSSMEVESVEYISAEYVNKIPNIAYTFPNLDAVARLIIVNENGGLLGCLQASFDNGKKVSHQGAKWATAVVAGIGLLASGLLSIFGNSASASRMSAAALSLFTYFQSIVILCMISVEKVPPIANDWAENLAWSMGLIRINFMQKIFRWYIQATGGTPTQYLTSGVKAILTQRSIDKVTQSTIWQKLSSFFSTSFESYEPLNLTPRYSPDQNPEYFIEMTNVKSNNYLHVLRGIERIGFDSDIEPSSIVCTGFTFFILCLYVLIGFFFIYRYLHAALNKGNRKTWLNKNLETKTSWVPTFKGMLSRYIYIGFPQLLILSLWEYTVQDSPAVITLSVFFMLLALIAMIYSAFQVIRFARESIERHGNPAAILYGNREILERYGFLYTMLDARKYWFCAVSLGYVFVKAMFVALAQDSGKTQAMALWILDMGYLGLLCHYLPYLDRFTNILFVFIQVITTINSFFFTFFSGIYGQPFRVASVMGLVFFIMNAAVALILLILILFIALVTVAFKNPDARFSPTKDDRTSFQQKHNVYANDEDAGELLALGAVAKEHEDGWVTEMYGISHEKSLENELSPKNSIRRGLGGLVGSLKRGLSSRNKSNVELPSSSENLYEHNDEYSEDQNVDQSTPSLEKNETVKQATINNPFSSDPFENEVPFDHRRNESHISGMTNDTAGLSVFGERINSGDYSHVIIPDHATPTNNLGQIQGHSGLNKEYLAAHEESVSSEDENDADDLREDVQHAYRRL